MSICCKTCGKENKDGSVICESCGNMLVDIFSVSESNNNVQNQVDFSADSVQGNNMKSQIEIVETEEKNQIMKQTSIETGSLSEYYFKIGGLEDIDEFVELARNSRKDIRLSDNEKKQVLEKLKERAQDVFAKEIKYYEEKGTFFGNLGSAVIWLICGLILGAIFTPLGIICYIMMTWAICKAIARLFTFPQSTHAAGIVKKLEQCGAYKRS
ncbi:MAG: hypothetical protein NC434_03165 [Ruminococcus sp.]|nr:hypothetical protein [Ruminococcus sp.]